MKSSTPLPSAALLASLAMLTPAPAQDAPAPPAPEPKVETEAAPAPAPEAPANAEVKPYLGLGASAVPDFLGKHLNLPPASGVMIRSLDPEGPAAKAGFTVDDVITKVAGKEVASHREMVDCFLTKKPGEEIAIDFIHEGKPGTRTVKLGERSVAQAAAPNPGPAGGPEIKVLEGQLNLPNGIGGIGGLGLGGGLAPELEKQMREAMEQALKNGGNQMRLQVIPGGAGGVQIIPGNGGNAKFGVASSVRMMDDQGGSIELKTVDGGSEVRVTDRAGKEIWSGAWDTEQDKAAAPPEIRKRIERLNIVPPQQQPQRPQLPEPEPAEEDAEN
jgi:hypothetical protein